MKRQIIIIPSIIISALLFACSEPNTQEHVTKKIRSEEFATLHSRVLQELFVNIAVLTRNDFIVIDNTVINLKARTYGPEPELGFYEEYYKSGSANTYNSLEELLKQKKIGIGEQSLREITQRMKKLGIGDITKDKKSKIVIYMWDMSVMWGSNGVVYSASGKIPKPYSFDKVERLNDLFFYWSNDRH